MTCALQVFRILCKRIYLHCLQVAVSVQAENFIPLTVALKAQGPLYGEQVLSTTAMEAEMLH